VNRRICVIAVLCLLCLWACAYDNDFDFDSRAYGPAEATEVVYVAEGAFTMGSDYSPEVDLLDGITDEPFTDEHPEHAVTVNAFFIDQMETTNKQYRACVYAGACTDPATRNLIGIDDYYTLPAYDDYPVTNVNWEQAEAYCTWRGRRLPDRSGMGVCVQGGK